MSAPRYRKPARWADLRTLTQVPMPAGLALPPGCWHIEEEDVPLLACARVAEAIHVGSGQPFTLLYAGDRIIGFATRSDGAVGAVPWGVHVSDWADRQRWQITSATKGG